MPKCEKFVKAYEACAERIKGDETGEAHCTVRCDAMRARARGRGGCVRGDSSARGVTTDAGTTTIRRRRDNTLTCTRAWTSAPRRKSWREPRDAARAYNITYLLTHSPTSTAVVSSFSSLHARSYTTLFRQILFARLRASLNARLSTTRTRSFLFPSFFTRRRRISSPTPLPFVSIAAARAAAAAAAPRRTHPSRTRRCTSRTTVSSSTARRERRKTPRDTRARVSSRAGVAHRARARTRWMFSRRSRARARASG